MSLSDENDSSKSNLRNENEVAYIRFASVYRKFNGVKDFIATLQSLKNTSKNELASIL